MKIYLAGQCPYPEALAHAESKHKKFLYSYAYLRKKNVADLRRSWTGQDIMLDSGGFTVRKSGSSLDVREYATFILRVQDRVQSYLNLDTRSIPESLAHQQLLESRGLSPMPVYHYSDWEDPNTRNLLSRFMEQYDYIALGGTAGENNLKERNKRFFEYCFRTGGKAVKFHGLGLSGVSLMSFFPFYSVDSKTWLVSGLYGDFVTTKNARYKRTAKKKGSLTHYGVMLPGPEKMKRAVDAFISLERFLTSVWAKRGYVWN